MNEGSKAFSSGNERVGLPSAASIRTNTVLAYLPSADVIREGHVTLCELRACPGTGQSAGYSLSSLGLAGQQVISRNLKSCLS